MTPLRTFHVESLAVISDLHLTHAGSRHPTGVIPTHAEELARQLIDEHEAVIVNGDLFDLDRGRVPLAHTRSLNEAWAANAPLLEILSAPGVLWVAGNHDAALTRRGLAHLALEVEIGGIRLRAEHGHRFNHPVKRLQRLTSAATWLHSRLPDLPIEGARRALSSVPAGSPVPPRAERWLRRQRGVDGLILGHTHHPYALRRGDHLMLNAGAWMSPPLTWLTLNGRRRTATACQQDGEELATLRW